MSHVFISYVRDNSEIVDRLVRDLRHAGVTVWLDRDAIQPGARWNEALEAAIRHGGFFIACYSREYLARTATYMDQELALAKWLLSQQRMPHNWFLPVLLNDCKPGELGLKTDDRLRTIQLVAMAGDWHDGLRRILGVVEPERSFGRCVSSPVPEQTRATKPPEAQVKLLAIDFGTSFSMVSYHSAAGGWQAIRDRQGRALQPSVIVFSDNWDYFAGWDALSAAQHRPERALFNIKRRLGKDQDFEVGHKRFDPVTMAALMIQYLRDCAEYELGYSVRNVVVSRPADFSARQTHALTNACSRAGLSIVRIVAEPVAAALVAMEWAKVRPADANDARDCTVVVVDVGGGTTDVCVVNIAELFQGEFSVEVIAVGGDNELGGMDYDEAAFLALKSKVIEPRVRAGMSWSQVDDHRLRVEVARAKAELGKAPVFRLKLTEIETAPGELGVLEMELDQRTFREASRALDARVASLVDSVLAQLAVEQSRPAHSSPFAAVLLAGQGGRIFTIAEYLRRRFPTQEIISTFQENAVSRGLSRQGGVLAGTEKGVLLLDVILRPILVRVIKMWPKREEDKERPSLIGEVSTRMTDNQLLSPMVGIATTIPLRVTEIFRAANAGTLTFDIVEGDRTAKVATDVLASLTVESVSEGDEFELMVDIDANGTPHFTVYDRKTHSQLAAARYSYTKGRAQDASDRIGRG
jgi:molecular chaperone DnaK (HSP70)